MVTAHSHKVSRVSWYSGYRLVTLTFAYGILTLFDRSFQCRSASLIKSRLWSEPRNARTPVWALSVSLAATSKITVVFFSSGYLDVSVHRVPGLKLWIHLRSHEGFSCRFPHSDICGSMCICHSPQLFAAYHVFLRLLVPRHPPCALCCFALQIHSVVFVVFTLHFLFKNNFWFVLGCLYLLYSQINRYSSVLY